MAARRSGGRRRCPRWCVSSPASADPALLVGLAPFDDAAVYKITDDLAVVSTTDFFPPLVDDPSDFGAIAAANVCSDVFAMGGRVVMALNISAFPERMPIRDDRRDPVGRVRSRARGGRGGRGRAHHSVRGADLRPRRAGARAPGEDLHEGRRAARRRARAVEAARHGHRARRRDAEQKAAAITRMRMLNRAASEALSDMGEAVHAVTDVTGYGLAGHGWEMAERSGSRLVFDDRRAFRSTTAPSRPRRQARGREAMRATASISLTASSRRWRPTRSRRCASTRRRRAAFSLRSTRRRHPPRRRPASPSSARSSPVLPGSACAHDADAVHRRSGWSATCGRRAMKSSSGSTRSGVARGQVRSRWGRRCCRATVACTRCATRRR